MDLRHAAYQAGTAKLLALRQEPCMNLSVNDKPPAVRLLIRSISHGTLASCSGFIKTLRSTRTLSLSARTEGCSWVKRAAGTVSVETNTGSALAMPAASTRALLASISEVVSAVASK